MPAAYWSMVGLLDKFTEGADEKTLTTEADALFRSLDGDNNGSIDKSELMKGFPHLDEGTAEILMTEADEDQDGSLSFDELLKVILEAKCDADAAEDKSAPENNMEAEDMRGRIVRLEAEVGSCVNARPFA